MFNKIKRGLGKLYKSTVILIIFKCSHKFYMKKYIKLLRFLGIKVNRPIYIDYSVWFDGTDYSMIEIEDDVVISKNVTLLVHDYSIARGLNAIDKHTKKEERIDGKIKIGKNCFIGINSTILPNTEIGENCIIGAGAVVRGKIEANSVIIGNPAIKIADTKEWASKKVKN